MKIAVLGTGNVGGTLGSRWALAGHEVTFGSRDPHPESEKVMELMQRCDGKATIASAVEAVADAEVIALCMPWNQTRAVLQSLGDLSGKVLIDCTNPLNESFTGLEFGFTTSAAEQIAAWVPNARVVKAFNTVSASTMADPDYHGQSATVFYCGDDSDAKAAVAKLASDLGMEPVDAGPLINARNLEPMAMLYIHLAVREGWGSNCAFKIMKR